MGSPSAGRSHRRRLPRRHARGRPAPRVHTDHRDAVGRPAAGETDYCAVSTVGPRNHGSKIVGGLPLTA